MSKHRFHQTPASHERAAHLFAKCNGILSTKDALRKGIHPRTLYALRDKGVLEVMSRGVFRLKKAKPLSQPDFVPIAMRVPNGVICLISALAFHELTTQIPHEVYLALRRGAEPPRIEYPPVRIFWFSGKAYTEGIETHRVDGIPLRVYSREKAIADLFKYRNKVGMDTVLESLRCYRSQKRPDVDRLFRFGQICRVAKVMQPYMEAILT